MDLRPVDLVTVKFEGPGAGSGPLAWGQIESWNAVRTLGHWMPVGGAIPLAPGATLDGLAEELRFNLCRHPTLRTLLRIPPDGGTPTQVVHPDGTYTLEVYDAGDDAPDDVAEAVAERYTTDPFDFEAEFPIRMAVVLHRGAPSHVVTLLSHFAADGFGVGVMLRDLFADATGPVAGSQPLDQAEWQRSPSGQRQNEAALRHFEEILRDMAPDRFPAPEEPLPSPRFWRGTYESKALSLALRLLADRTGADPSVTLLAVFALAAHRTFGTDPVVLRPVVSNRFRPGLADVVCTAVQAGLCRVPIGGAPFTEVVDRARRATMRAYKYAYFDQRDLFALRDRVGAERGARLEIGMFLNDRRDAADGPVPSPADITAALPDSRFTWVLRRDAPGFEPMILDVESVEGGVLATAHTDTAAVSPAGTEAFLRNLEDVAVTAALS